MTFNDFIKLFPGKIDTGFLLSLKEERDRGWKKGHGPEYLEAINSLPSIGCDTTVEDGVFTLLGEGDERIEELAKKLVYWKKGPFNLFGTQIESEWRSDFKWDRLKDALPDLKNKTVLDIGCNNGYFMYRMLEQQPKAVLGIEPFLLYKAQFDFINHFVQADNLKVELFGVEHLNAFKDSFDVIFSMGILYHHRAPNQQLFDMRMALRSGGTLILETIGIPGEEEVSLTPSEKYAGMGNIWHLPTLNCLKLWLTKNKFHDIEVISTEWGTTDEQRATEWASSVSFKDFLDLNDSSKTIEGYPAPERFILKATKK